MQTAVVRQTEPRLVRRPPSRRYAAGVLRALRGLGIRFACVVLLLAGSASAAHACLWSVYNWFLPLPPCYVSDELSLYRNQQETVRVLGKLPTIALQIKEVRTEILQWRQAYRTARLYRDELAQAYGDLITDPLPSLEARFNRTPVGKLIRLAQNGTFVLLDTSAAGIPFRRVADSVWGHFADSLEMGKLYRRWNRLADMPRNVYQTGGRLEEQLVALADWERFSAPIVDSLQAIGARTAARYVGQADVAGLSEARISQLSAALTRLRGTAFETQARGISAQVQAVATASKRQRLIERAMQRNTAFLRF